MFRILRIGLLGLVCTVPFAVPQASQAASPASFVRCRPYVTWHRYHVGGHYRHFHSNAYFCR